MIKLMGILHAKPGLSQADFIEYYEKHHAPLIISLFPQVVRYQRNYPLPAAEAPGAGADRTMLPVEFSVITEMWLQDRNAYNEMIALLSDPTVGARIAADEEQFLDRSRVTAFFIDERRSEV